MGDLPAQQFLIGFESHINRLNNGLPCFTFFNIPVDPLFNKYLFQG